MERIILRGFFQLNSCFYILREDQLPVKKLGTIIIKVKVLTSEKK